MRFVILTADAGTNQIFINNDVTNIFTPGSFFDLVDQQTFAAVTPARLTVSSSSFALGTTTVVVVEDFTGSDLDGASSNSFLAISGHYIVDFSNTLTKPSFEIAPYTVDDGTTMGHTSLTLPGRGVLNYGEILTENLIHILENFANDTPPPHPTEGQVWYDNSAIINRPQLMIYNGSSWVSVADHYVLKTGDTMTGGLTLNADPTLPLEAATKQYVDAYAKRYEVAGTQFGLPGANEIIIRRVITTAVEFAALNAGESVAVAGTASTGNFICFIKKNGVSFATVEFNNTSTTGVFDNGTATFVSGDILTVEAPPVQDATLSDLTITLVGTLNY